MNAIAPAAQLETTTLFRPDLVTIENLQVRFGDVVAVESLDFTVRRGEFVSLLGPSGCGKSTLLRAIARLVPVAGGRVLLRDPNLRIGFMFPAVADDTR
jgi:ABC-type Fe3+/spermidine/putrescine transport system ATPase subunit